MGKTIFEFEDKFGVISPFDNWVSAQQKPLGTDKAEIIEILIEQGDKNEKLFKNTVIYDNLDPAKYRPKIYDIPKVESKTEIVKITISVTIKGLAEAVYISVDGNKQRATNWLNNTYTVFEIEVPKKEGEKKIEISAQLTDYMGNTVIDTKKIIATIGLSGNVLSKKDLENDCTFSIKNGFVIGANVVTKRDDSKVKSSGTLNTVKAIVLHRTVGYNISGAIGHSKGTHFYVEGGRVSGKDGEIFQSMSLQKSSNHIFNETARTSHLDIKTNNSIGIEVIGMAYKKVGEKYYTNTSNPKEIDTTKTPITKGYKDKNGNFNYWDKLTDSQIKSTVCLVRLLMDSYSIKPEMILTHEEIQSKTSGEGQAVKDAIFDKLIEK